MNADELHHYSRALDEIYRLRGLLAFEAAIIQGHLQLATFPRSRRVAAEEQIRRMTTAAIGQVDSTFTSNSNPSMKHVRQQLGIETLTRWAFEQEQSPSVTARPALRQAGSPFQL